MIKDFDKQSHEKVKDRVRKVFLENSQRLGCSKRNTYHCLAFIGQSE